MQVILVNLQCVQTVVLVKSIGKVLFDQITNYLGLKETIYFGLTQLKGDEHEFIDLETKLSKYSPSWWKSKPSKKQQAFTLYFRVRYFMDDPLSVRHSLTRHLIYLQLRLDILNALINCPGKWFCYLFDKFFKKLSLWQL